MASADSFPGSGSSKGFLGAWSSRFLPASPGVLRGNQLRMSGRFPFGGRAVKKNIHRGRAGIRLVSQLGSSGCRVLINWGSGHWCSNFGGWSSVTQRILEASPSFSSTRTNMQKDRSSKNNCFDLVCPDRPVWGCTFECYLFFAGPCPKGAGRSFFFSGT